MKCNKHFSKVIKYLSLRSICTLLQQERNKIIEKPYCCSHLWPPHLPRLWPPTTSTPTRASQCNKMWETNKLPVFNKRNKIWSLNVHVSSPPLASIPNLSQLQHESKEIFQDRLPLQPYPPTCNPPASTSWGFGLQAWATVHSLKKPYKQSL